MKRAAVRIPALALAALSLIAAAAPFRFPATVPGGRAAAYLEAYNSGREDAVRACIQENVPPEALAQRSMDERLAGFHRMWDDQGRLTPVELVEATGEQIRIRARSSHDDVLDLTFVFEPEAPNRLIGLRGRDRRARHGRRAPARERAAPRRPGGGRVGRLARFPGRRERVLGRGPGREGRLGALPLGVRLRLSA